MNDGLPAEITEIPTSRVVPRTQLSQSLPQTSLAAFMRQQEFAEKRQSAEIEPRRDCQGFQFS